MESNLNKIALSPEIAEYKIKQWCAYQERSTYETQQKLYEYGLNELIIEEIISNLISDNFLNEERFALTFAGGKFRIKRWGKLKIKSELKWHKISDYSIKKALNSISDEDYLKTINFVIEKKNAQLRLANKVKNYFTILNYLASRGFERDIVTEQLTKIFK